MVPRSISPTTASCEISSAISGSRKIVRLERLTTTTSSAPAPTLPVGALPRNVRDSESAASSSVVARTQRLRNPSLISLPAMMTMFLTRPSPACEENGRRDRRGSAPRSRYCVTRGSPAATRNKSIFRASSCTSMTRPCGVASDSPVIHADGTSLAPGARSSETRIGSCEIERSSANVPCATSTPRFMIRTCSARSSSSLRACDEIKTVAPSSRSSFKIS